MQRLAAIFLCFCLLLTGCGWLDGEYHSVTPYQQHSGTSDNKTETAKNYLQLRTALENMVSTGTESSIITVAEFQQEKLEQSMDMAVRYVKTSFPIGAYAVEDITYEVGTVGGATAVAVTIQYRHERSEIQKIRKVPTMERAQELIESALYNCDASLVMLVNNYEPTDIQQLVDDYAAANPSIVMETPEVSEQMYPESGLERVWVLRFSYQTSREDLRAMRGQVERIFNSAALYVSQDAGDGQKLSQLYSFLMERFDEYQIKTSITPAYSLLSHGVGDSKAFAEVYAEMCARAGVECHVVVGTRGGQSWSWNIVLDDGYYYHVDLLTCQSRGGYRALTDGNMADYVWDYSSYPVCIDTPPVVEEDPTEAAPETTNPEPEEIPSEEPIEQPAEDTTEPSVESGSEATTEPVTDIPSEPTEDPPTEPTD